MPVSSAINVNNKDDDPLLSVIAGHEFTATATRDPNPVFIRADETKPEASDEGRRTQGHCRWRHPVRLATHVCGGPAQSIDRPEGYRFFKRTLMVTSVKQFKLHEFQRAEKLREKR